MAVWNRISESEFGEAWTRKTCVQLTERDQKRSEGRSRGKTTGEEVRVRETSVPNAEQGKDGFVVLGSLA